MKKITLFIISLLINHVVFAQWQNLNTGIEDTLTGIVFFSNQGVVSGENGVYYTLNGGDGSANWQRFEITDNTANAQLYANSKFTSCYSNPLNSGTTFTTYFVGEDIVNNKAVIMSLEIPSLVYSIITLDIPNSKLNDIKYSRNYSRYYAVGNHKLLLYFEGSIASPTVVSTGAEGTDNYTSISFNSTGFMARIGSENKYFIMTTSGHQLTPADTPGETHNDMTYATYSVNDKYMSHNFTNKIVYSNYDYGPINGNGIFAYSSRNFIGTDHGIFMSNANREILQWQPSSGNLNIIDFWSSGVSAILYACGSDGAVLKNETPIQTAKPYVRVDFNGGCLSTISHDISATTGDSSTCAWFIDDVLVSSACNSFDYSFTTAGVYNIKLVVDYNGLITESTKSVHIVNDPEIDKPITILDTILCHEEPLQISISNSEPDVFYTLHKTGSSAVYGTSETGNGGTITLNSSPLNETGNYYLKSANVNAPSCTKTFTDTFEIIVEQTEANFHIGLLNASTNEDITFHQTSQEASTYDWTFTGAANVMSSLDENPTNSFNTNGIHDVTLTATSVNLCADDITLSSPNIITEPSETTECWSYINQSELPNPNSYEQDITHITEVTDGYLTGGYYKNEIFGTNHGIEHNIDGTHGGFLSKHNDKGTLKWIVYTTASSSSQVFASAEDQNGDIYLSINSNTCDFFDNSGKQITFNKGGNIVKLNSNGELIWYMAIRTYVATGLTVDNDNNLIIYGTYDIYGDVLHNVYLNDQLVDEVGTIIFPESGDRFCNGIIKATPEGSILWDNEIFSTSGTSGVDQHTRYIGVDANNNLYVEGQYKNHMYIYHTGATESTDYDYHQYNAGGSFYGHVLKLNSDGALQWVTRSYITEYGLYKSVFHHDTKTDNDGNTYITGSSNYGGAGFTHIHNVENADGSTFSTDEAQTYFLKKINANGFVDFIIGTEEDINSDSRFPSGFQLEVKNNIVTTIGKIKSNITTPENVMFYSILDDDITAPLTANDLFLNTYTTDGVLTKVAVFDGFIEDPYNITFRGLISKNLNNYYIGSNFGSSFSDRDGRINFLNGDFCGTTYSSTLSINEFETQVAVSVVPNPNNGEFQLILDRPFYNCKVTTYNTLGQVISKEEFLNNTEINLSVKDKSGLYFVEINADGKFNTTVKVIVK